MLPVTGPPLVKLKKNIPLENLKLKRTKRKKKNMSGVTRSNQSLLFRSEFGAMPVSGKENFMNLSIKKEHFIKHDDFSTVHFSVHHLMIMGCMLNLVSI